MISRLAAWLGLALLALSTLADAQTRTDSTAAASQAPVRTTGLNTFGPTMTRRISARVADTIPYHFGITLLPFSFFGQGLELAGEVMLTNKTSLHVAGGYFLGTEPWFYDGSDNFSGWRGEAQLRFYTTDMKYGRHGFYMGPFFQMKHIKLDETVITQNGWLTSQSTKSYRVTAPSFGVLVGFEGIVAKSLILDSWLGGGLIIPSNEEAAKKVNIPLVNPYNPGVILKVGVGIGLAR